MLSSFFGSGDRQAAESHKGTDADTEDEDCQSSSSIHDSVGQSSKSQLDTAEALLRAAEAKFAVADDVAAMRLLQQSFQGGCILPGASELHQHLVRYGPSSAASNIVMRTLNAKDDRAVLGVTEPISPTRLKKAYRRLCLELHPDRCQARRAEEAFKRVQEAYAALNPSEVRSSAARAAAKRAGRRQAERRQQERDRGWTSRGIDPRYGAPATRGRRPTHLEPPTMRANGKAFAPKAGPPPRPSYRASGIERPSTLAGPAPMEPMEA